MNDPKYTAKRAKFVFAQDMQPCPKCGSWHFMVQTPIKMEPFTATDTAKQLVGKWARATIAGAVMDGPVFIMCFDCGHKGPGVPCEGRSRDEVGQDRALYTEVKRLWNAQPAHLSAMQSPAKGGNGGCGGAHAGPIPPGGMGGRTSL